MVCPHRQSVAAWGVAFSSVRREIRAAGMAGRWTLRLLRQTFVSLMSGSGVPVEGIARLVGYPSSALPNSRAVDVDC
jgi:hypothetical protein